MSVSKKRQTSGRKKRRASHHALKPLNLIPVDGENVPHGLKKALTLKKTLKTRTK